VKLGLTTVTVAVACAAPPTELNAVSITELLPTGYGPGGVCNRVSAPPDGLVVDPLLIFAAAVPPVLAATTVTLVATAVGNRETLQFTAHAGI